MESQVKLPNLYTTILMTKQNMNIYILYQIVTEAIL